MIRIHTQGRKGFLTIGRVNAGVEADYFHHMRLLIRRMHRDVLDIIKRHYLKAETELAQDSSPIDELHRSLDDLHTKWLDIFNKESENIATQFIHKNQNDCEGNLRKRFKKSGFVMQFKPDANMRKKIKFAVSENVSLIKSIGEQYQNGVNALVSRAVLSGGDLGTLTKELKEHYGISEKRAAMIARDQNHKINQTVERMRCTEIGLKEARWKHLGGGRHPRQDHVKADGRRYLVAKGCEISGEYIQPGQLINCHCRAQYIIPGYND